MSFKFGQCDTRQLPRLIEAGASDCGNSMTSLSRFLRENRAWLKNQLQESGALLFRGFGLENENQLSQLVQNASDETIDYTGGAGLRAALNRVVYNSSDAKPYLAIPLHCEVCYLERIPQRLFFMCKTPPGRDGQTPIADMADVVDAMDPSVVEALETRGVMFVHTLATKRSMFGVKTWMESFATKDRDHAESVAIERGYEVEWKANDLMVLRRRHPALIRHPVHGRRIWFNQIQTLHDSWSWELKRTGHPWKAEFMRWVEWRRKSLPFEQCSHQTAFGDGEMIPNSMVEHIRETLWQHAKLFDWQRGDVIVLDNLWIGHGRLPFQGERQILLAMANPIDAIKLRPSLAAA